MKNPELNFIDRFLYKLLIGTFLLLAVIFLSRLQVINIEDVRFELGQHYNILKIIKALNGKNNFLLPIDISDSVASEVALVYDKSKKIPNGYRIELTEFQGVEAYRNQSPPAHPALWCLRPESH
ncbi:MAG: hypothetical protein PHV87_05195, partial [Bacilli bacterium]|nr:hypothetical protein [Bacilli bacterium]